MPIPIHCWEGWEDIPQGPLSRTFQRQDSDFLFCLSVHTYSSRVRAARAGDYVGVHHPQGQRPGLVDLGLLALALLLGCQV